MRHLKFQRPASRRPSAATAALSLGHNWPRPVKPARHPSPRSTTSGRVRTSLMKVRRPAGRTPCAGSPPSVRRSRGPLATPRTRTPAIEAFGTLRRPPERPYYHSAVCTADQYVARATTCAPAREHYHGMSSLQVGTSDHRSPPRICHPIHHDNAAGRREPDKEGEPEIAW